MAHLSDDRVDYLVSLIERESWCPCGYDTALVSWRRQLCSRVERYLTDAHERQVIEAVIHWKYE